MKISDIPEGWSYTTVNHVAEGVPIDFQVAFGSGGPDAYNRFPVLTAEIFLGDVFDARIRIESQHKEFVDTTRAYAEAGAWDDVKRNLWAKLMLSLTLPMIQELVTSTFEHGRRRGRRQLQEEFARLLGYQT